MEYFSYILVVLLILAVVLFLVRIPGRSRLKGKPADLSDRARKRRAQLASRNRAAAAREELEMRHQALQRELLRVPTPWGWPGHGQTAADGSSGGADRATASLHHWVDLLIREKRTVDDREYRSKQAASLRALLEDRYGRASRMQEVEYRQVKRPLLRDPSEPHDQMDNFPSGKGDELVAKLRGQPKGSSPILQATRVRKVSGLEDIRTPWGW